MPLWIPALQYKMWIAALADPILTSIFILFFSTLSNTPLLNSVHVPTTSDVYRIAVSPSYPAELAFDQIPYPAVARCTTFASILGSM